MPQMQKPTDQDLANRFMHHAPVSQEQIDTYTLIRAKMLETAVLIRDLTPCCPEQTRAFNELEFAMFLAVAAVARNFGVA